jgi:hypothetical protein
MFVLDMTQPLIHYRFVDRTFRAGGWRDRFVIRSGAWARMMLWRLELLQRLQEVAGDGLELLPTNGDPEPPPEVRKEAL